MKLRDFFNIDNIVMAITCGGVAFVFMVAINGWYGIVLAVLTVAIMVLLNVRSYARGVSDGESTYRRLLDEIMFSDEESA